MRLFWSILSGIYSDLYCIGIHFPVPKILFNKPKNKLDCKYRQVILADSSFNLKERALILEALDDLQYFCNGLISLEIIFELDNSDRKTINNNCTLIKANEKHPAIKASDKKINSKTIGLCQFMTNNTRRIYLVSERLKQDIIFKTTVVHELGHFIELTHTKPFGLMHQSNFENILYLTYIDAKETAKVWKINPEDLRYFKL